MVSSIYHTHYNQWYGHPVKWMWETVTQIMCVFEFFTGSIHWGCGLTTFLINVTIGHSTKEMFVELSLLLDYYKPVLKYICYTAWSSAVDQDFLTRTQIVLFWYLTLDITHSSKSFIQGSVISRASSFIWQRITFC